MIRLPIKYRNDDDDYAPIDYQFVGSVREGERRRQAESLHKTADRAVVRHRVEPDARADEYGTRARRSRVARPEERSPQRPPLPITDEAMAQRVAFSHVQDRPSGEREDAESSHSPAISYGNRHPQPAGMRRVEPLESPVIPYAEGYPHEERYPHENTYRRSTPGMKRDEVPEPEFDPPVAPEIPDWLKVAMQNNLSVADKPLRPQVTSVPAAQEQATDALGRPVRRRAEARRVGELPQSAADYAEAGYPQELLYEQERQDFEREAQRYGPKRHGAERATAYERTLGDRRSRNLRRGQAAPPHAMGRGEASPAYEYAYPYAHTERNAAPVAYGYAYPPDAAERGEASAAAVAYDYAYPYAHTERGEASAAPMAYDYAYPSGQIEEEDAPPEASKRIKIPWLGIAVSALMLTASLMYVLQVTFARRTEAAIEAREQAEQAIADAHPYSYRSLIEDQAQRNNLHPAFVAAIVLNESSFEPDAESSVGARGLMQVMEGTAKDIHDKIGGGAPFDFDLMYDPDTNVRYACWYLNYISGLFRGDPILVAVGFHAGPNYVRNLLDDDAYSTDHMTIPLEKLDDGPSKQYATRVLRAYSVYKRLYYENAGG